MSTLIRGVSMLLVLGLAGCEPAETVAGLDPPAGGVDVVASLSIAPSQVTLVGIGSSVQLQATARTPAGKAIPANVTWTSLEPQVATVSAQGLVTAAGVGTARVTARYQGVADTTTILVELVPTLIVSPDQATLVGIASTVQLQATAGSSTGAAAPSTQITWISLDPQVATVSGQGLVTAAGVGSARITATYQSVADTASILVQVASPPSSPSIAVSPETATLTGVGATVQLQATAKTSTGETAPSSQVTWTSLEPQIATVSAQGLVTAAAAGTARITATYQSVADTASILVQVAPPPSSPSIVVSPETAALTGIGNTLQLQATAKTSTGASVPSSEIAWTSLQPSLATVSSSGLVTAVAGGTARIRAAYQTIADTATITITPAATGKFVIGGRVRATLDVSVRSAPASTGTLLGVQPAGALGTVVAGPTTDAAGDGLVRWNINFDSGADGWAAEDFLESVAPPGTVASVTVSPKPASVPLGSTLQLTAVARDSSGTIVSGSTMSWTSRNPLLATVSATGLLTSVAVGSAYVIASSGGKLDSTQVTVALVPVASVLVTPATASVAESQTIQLTATVRDLLGNTLTGRVITWATSNSSLATVSSTGLVTGRAAGTATITVTSEGQSASAAVTVTSTPTLRNGWYVSPSGSSGASGTSSSPWNLATALSGAGGRVRPGDTVWVRGGTYYAPFRSTLNGQAGSYVVVRAYPGERAIVDGRDAPSDNFIVAGTYSIFWGLEFTNTATSRSTSVYTNNYRANNVINNGANNKYINIIVYDGGVAFFNYSNRANVEVNGSIFYNNGWQGPTRGHGHALYLKSDVGPLIAMDNIIFNQFGYGIHMYTDNGSGLLNNIRLEGNVSFNNGSVATTGTSANLGNLGEPNANNLGVLSNMTYFSPGIGATNLTLGSGAGLTATGNYVVGGSGITQGSWSGASISGNTVLSSTAGGSTRVFVRPSLYEPGRANVIVYNWGGQGSVSVPLAGVLNAGESYVVRHVFNLYGAPVASGTFGGGSITIPLTSVSAPMPIGWSRNGPSVGNSFAVFIVSKS